MGFHYKLEIIIRMGQRKVRKRKRVLHSLALTLELVDIIKQLAEIDSGLKDGDINNC